jgi:hypothetical protein
MQKSQHGQAKESPDANRKQKNNYRQEETAVQLSPFHAYYKARTLAGLAGRDKFAAAFESSDIEIFLYQVSAALFALRSPF